MSVRMFLNLSNASIIEVKQHAVWCIMWRIIWKLTNLFLWVWGWIAIFILNHFQETLFEKLRFYYCWTLECIHYWSYATYGIIYKWMNNLVVYRWSKLNRKFLKLFVVQMECFLKKKDACLNLKMKLKSCRFSQIEYIVFCSKINFEHCR